MSAGPPQRRRRAAVLGWALASAFGSWGAAPGAAHAQTVTESVILPHGSDPREVVTGPDRNLWVTASGTDQLLRVTGAGGAVTEFSAGITPGAAPTGIAAGPDGNVWFTEPGADRIGRITPLGVVTEFAVPSPGSTPRGIATGADGNLWFTAPGTDRIGRITPLGVVTEFAVPGAGSAPTGITAGPDGNVWFTEPGASEIGRITPGGAVTEWPIAPQAAPESITAGPDGALWFVSPTGGLLGRITVAGDVTTWPQGGASTPTALTAAPDGNLWFTDPGTNAVARVAPATPQLATAFALPGFGRLPAGITTGPDDHLWFVERGVDLLARVTTADETTGPRPPRRPPGSGPGGGSSGGPGGVVVVGRAAQRGTPSIWLGAGVAQVTGGRAPRHEVRVPLACAASGDRCTGTFVLTVPRRPTVGDSRTTVSITSAAFTIPAGSVSRLVMPISRASRRLITAAKKRGQLLDAAVSLDGARRSQPLALTSLAARRPRAG